MNAIPRFDIEVINADVKRLKKILRANGFPAKLLSAVETRALRSQRRQTGAHQSNRASRWNLKFEDPEHGTDSQYGTEVDCKTILIVLLLTTLEFKGAPQIADGAIQELATKYLGRELIPNSYKDSLLLEFLDFQVLRSEAENPTHGKSPFHLGHEDPHQKPKHTPENVAWRTLRSNLIQGDMTLREARIYIVKLIARYFELGELDLR